MGAVVRRLQLRYISSVVRAGEQMDRNVNPVGLPISPVYDPTVAAVNPRPVTRSTDFWTQGLNFGVGVSF
ncbi:MAG: BBP7 family outer membrane beta-barrel protein [Gemmataceae bacterium]